MEFLSPKFVMDYVNNNEYPLNPLGAFTYTRTYSRWLDSVGRREYWHETVKRAIEYSMSLGYQHMLDNGIKPNLKEMVKEAEEFFVNMYNTKQFLSGRSLWLGNGNVDINRNYAAGNFNCSYTSVRKWEDFGEIFYLLTVGSGVGFKATKKMARDMKAIRNNTELIVNTYEEKDKEDRNEDKQSTLTISEDGISALIEINDSKEAWADSLMKYFTLLTSEEYSDIQTITINFDNIRPKGDRLVTFGGFASGYEPMRDMFVGIDKVLKNKMDESLAPLETSSKGEGYVHIRPVHILDISNLIANNVVAGGVRRSAQLFLFDADDYESLLAKYGINGIWDEKQYAQHLKVGKRLDELGIKPSWFDGLEIGSQRTGFGHRNMSNNSVGFTRKPTRKELNLLFEIMQLDGEPGFVNLAEAARRVLKAEGNNTPTEQEILDKADIIGLNPCVEIILHEKNVCNLTTVNVKAFANEDGTLDEEGLLNAQRISARTALRMTLIKLELPEWDKVQQRDRLLGNSLTGWKDAMDIVGFTQQEEDELKVKLKNVSRESANEYADELGINRPMFTTAVKPEGTLSQVAGGVSSGLHWAHSPYFTRRIRITATDPLSKVAEELGWKIHAEVGTNGFMEPEDLARPMQIESATTLVIDFPVKSGAKTTKDDVTVNDQFDNYFSFQDKYTDMNTSNTITVRDATEWADAEDRVFNGWDNFVGVSFLALDGGSYNLAPYEAISKEQYEKFSSEMKPYDSQLLVKFEETETTGDLDGIEDPECVGGVCPVR